MMADEPREERPDGDGMPAGLGGDPDRLVQVAVARSGFEASLLVVYLADHGVEARSFDMVERGFSFALSATRPGVPVCVRAVDHARARSVLRDRRAESDSIDWDSVDVGDPAPPAAAIVPALPMLLAIGIPIALAILLVILFR